MKKKIKIIALCCVLICSMLAGPVTNALAYDENAYSEDVPSLEGIDFYMTVNGKSNRDVLLDTVMKAKTVDYFVFTFEKLEDVDYEDYDIAFDFVMKSKLDDGTIKSFNITKWYDVESTGKLGFFDDVSASLSFKDEYYKISLEFPKLVKLSPYCQVQERYVADNLNFTAKKVEEFNTVISQVDCYLRHKSTGKTGMIAQYVLTWDSNFWWSLCTNVKYNLIVPTTKEILESGSNTNLNGAYGYDSDGDNAEHEARSVLSDLVTFFTDIPAAIVAFFTGFFDVTMALQELILAVFPFVPVFVVNAFILVFYLVVLFSGYSFIKGIFG